MNKELSYLTSLFGASGSERDVRQAILNEIQPLCDRMPHSADELHKSTTERKKGEFKI